MDLCVITIMASDVLPGPFLVVAMGGVREGRGGVYRIPPPSPVPSVSVFCLRDDGTND